MPIFISYTKKSPKKAKKRFSFSLLEKRRLKNREKVKVAANDLINDFKKTEEGKFHIEMIEFSKKSRAKLIANKENWPSAKGFIKILNEKIWYNKTNFYKELILYAKEKKTKRNVIKYLQEEAKNINKPSST